MLVVNAEFRFPIVERVTGVVFTDWGRAWDNDEKITLSELNNSFGLGVRLDTPLGLLRLDYGFGKDEENKRTGQFYFGVGQTF
jgi:outer membrane protein insertion porin family